MGIVANGITVSVDQRLLLAIQYACNRAASELICDPAVDGLTAKNQSKEYGMEAQAKMGQG